MKEAINQIFTELIAILSLVSVLLLWKHNFILTVVLIILAILMLLMNKSKQEVKTFVFCAFFGAMAEAFAIVFGAWTYRNPSFIGIPIWLTVLWGIASVFIVRVYLSFKN
ncbi:MAG: DUF2878 family protein [Candidatus Schekmanbacteria bacterium]|nr:MAG: DUF2878 family protein [Candidatus Schekmanbacteria bacterium]